MARTPFPTDLDPAELKIAAEKMDAQTTQRLHPISDNNMHGKHAWEIMTAQKQTLGNLWHWNDGTTYSRVQLHTRCVRAHTHSHIHPPTEKEKQGIVTKDDPQRLGHRGTCGMCPIRAL